MKRIVLAGFLLLLLGGYCARAQELTPEEKLANYKIETVLTNLNAYRFGHLNLYILKDPTKVEEIIRPYLSIGGAATVDTAAVNALKEKHGEDVYLRACDLCEQGNGPFEISETLFDEFGVSIALEDIDQICSVDECSSGGFTGVSYQRIYVFTTRPQARGDIGEVIAIYASKTAFTVIDDLLAADAKSLLTFVELENIPNPEDPNNSNLKDIIEDYLRQGYVSFETQELQGQGNKNWFVRKKYGNTESLIKEEDIESKDVQTFIRISEGLPHDIKEGKVNELIVSPDLISWRRYPWDEEIDDPFETVTNERLPIYGAELKYGLEAINIPSFFSERWTLNAIWKNVKMGIILPTPGWTEAFTDLYSIDDKRKFTTGGPGISVNFNFPFPVVPQSGIFNLEAGYVSGDAAESSFKLDVPNVPGFNDENYDYLIRAHGKLHYTFGMAIDDNYMLRFGLGGSVYNVERWHYEVESEDEGGQLVINKNFVVHDDKTIGGLSGTVEFMTKNISTPWGASLNYFDDSILGQVWLQIPVIENTLALRIDGKGYFVLRSEDNLHEWEMGSGTIVIPMARVLYFF